jgi:hypothetical protein
MVTPTGSRPASESLRMGDVPPRRDGLRDPQIVVCIDEQALRTIESFRYRTDLRAIRLEHDHDAV